LGYRTTDVNSNDDIAGNFNGSGNILTMQFGVLPVIAGASFDPNTFAPTVSVARYLPNGVLDPLFGTGGISNTGQNDNFASFLGEITGVAAQPDGKIVVVGDFQDATSGAPEFFLERLDMFGHLDPSFGCGGQVVLASSNLINTAGLVIQSNGKIDVASTVLNSTGDMAFAVTQFDSQGNLTSYGNGTTYGGGGTAVADFAPNNATVAGIALTPGGRVVLAGTLNGQSIGLAQFTPTGGPDTTIGLGGTRVLPQVSTSDAAGALTVDENGKILVAGSTALNNGDFLLLRLKTDGSPDTTFGMPDPMHLGMKLGYVTTDFRDPTLPNNPSNTDGATSVTFDLFGRIVVGGTSAQTMVNNGTTSIALARYTANGTLDTSFGTTVLNRGKVLTTFPGVVAAPVSLGIELDNKIVVGCTIDDSSQGTFHDFLVARYLSDTSPYLLVAHGGSSIPTPPSLGGTGSLGASGNSDTVAALAGDGEGQAAPLALDHLFTSLVGQTSAKPDPSDGDGNLFDPFNV
jgi:uncharacterized delta-60 repeat protein